MQSKKTTFSTQIGNIKIGGDAPVVVQSMTNTDTADVAKTTQQCLELANAGSELVRLTVNNEQAAAAIPKIVENLDKQNCHVPLIGDFHYNGHKLLQDFPDCAKSLAKYRINPGNVGFGSKKDQQFATMIEMACKYNKPIRIGVNWGSLDQSVLAAEMDNNKQRQNLLSAEQVLQNALITSALQSAEIAEKIGLPKQQIILSCKVSAVPDLISVYTELSKRCNYALHLGLTEAGMGIPGIVSSTAALAILLNQGIGDTIRISLTPTPNGSRCDEVRVAQEILQSLNLRAFKPTVIACPGCGRTTSTVFQKLAEDVNLYLQTQMPTWKVLYPGVEMLNIAIMGCIVNGPGESKHAHIGISLPGTGEEPAAPVYVDGKKVATLKGNAEELFKEFIKIIENYIKQTFL